MKTQTFTGTVLDTAGDPWEDALVELQLDDGTGEISIAGPTVTGVTDASGDFSIDAYNNSDEEQTLLIRLPNGNLFSAAIDPEDDTIALGDLESSGGTDTVKLSVIPSAGSDPTAAIAAARMGADVKGDVVVRGIVGGKPFEQRYPLELKVSSAAGSLPLSRYCVLALVVVARTRPLVLRIAWTSSQMDFVMIGGCSAWYQSSLWRNSPR